MTSNEILFLIGAAVFVVTGVLAAARQNMDVMSFVVIGVVTAIGGGTLRDVLLNRHPIFWIRDPIYLVVTSVAALGTMGFVRLFRPPRHTLTPPRTIRSSVT